MSLTAQNVEDAFLASLYPDGTGSVETATIARGVVLSVGFDPERLEGQRETVKEMLSHLPHTFMHNGGGGWSFLNMCMDKDDKQWTGMHQTQDQLLTLGIALGYITFPLPREMWSALPGGVPYLTVTL